MKDKANRAHVAAGGGDGDKQSQCAAGRFLRSGRWPPVEMTGGRHVSPGRAKQTQFRFGSAVGKDPTAPNKPNFAVSGPKTPISGGQRGQLRVAGWLGPAKARVSNKANWWRGRPRRGVGVEMMVINQVTSAAGCAMNGISPGHGSDAKRLPSPCFRAPVCWYKEASLARNNYSYQKRSRELAKKKKKEEKRLRKLARANPETSENPEPTADESQAVGSSEGGQ